MLQAEETMTVTLPADMVRLVKEAVASGDYPSTHDVFIEAIQQWSHQREAAWAGFEDTQSAVAKGLADINAGRVKDAEVVFSILKAKYSEL